MLHLTKQIKMGQATLKSLDPNLIKPIFLLFKLINNKKDSRSHPFCTMIDITIIQ